MEEDAMAKELSGTQVVVMAEDVPALQAMKPGGKKRPIDRIVHDGDTVTLGGVVLTAHLTASHTRGATTSTMKAKEGRKSFDVVFYSSLRSPVVLTQPVVDEFNRSFQLVRTLPCDVPLGDHPAEFRMIEKYPKLQNGSPNPYIDVPGCKLEAEIEEGMFHAILQEQEKPEKRKVIP
jgi:metallo-beta-lactamase class B